jgi:hypothetical protein
MVMMLLQIKLGHGNKELLKFAHKAFKTSFEVNQDNCEVAMIMFIQENCKKV